AEPNAELLHPTFEFSSGVVGANRRTVDPHSIVRCQQAVTHRPDAGSSRQSGAGKVDDLDAGVGVRTHRLIDIFRVLPTADSPDDEVEDVVVSVAHDVVRSRRFVNAATN